MGLLNETRKFVKKFIKSPILSAGAAYLIYKILSKKMKTESLMENIKVLQKDGEFEVIYDDISKTYSVIDGRGVHNDFYPVKDISEAKKLIQKLKSKKNSYQGEEKMKENYMTSSNWKLITDKSDGTMAWENDKNHLIGVVELKGDKWRAGFGKESNKFFSTKRDAIKYVMGRMKAFPESLSKLNRLYEKVVLKEANDTKYNNLHNTMFTAINNIKRYLDSKGIKTPDFNKNRDAFLDSLEKYENEL